MLLLLLFSQTKASLLDTLILAPVYLNFLPTETYAF